MLALLTCRSSRFERRRMDENIAARTGRQGILHPGWNVWRKDVVLS